MLPFFIYFQPMKTNRFTSFLLFVSIITCVACKKDCPPDNTVVNPPVQNDYQQYGIPFDSVPETKNIVMYEVNLRAFSSGGNIQGIINRLDQLEALHVNVIWLKIGRAHV